MVLRRLEINERIEAVSLAREEELACGAATVVRGIVWTARFGKVEERVVVRQR